MKLDQFITQTLISIVSGIKNADKEAHEKQLSTYTKGTFEMSNFGGETKDGKYINFDVAVTTSSKIAADVQGSGDIIIASLDGNVEAKHSQENISRIKFKILYNGQ